MAKAPKLVSDRIPRQAVADDTQALQSGAKVFRLVESNACDWPSPWVLFQVNSADLWGLGVFVVTPARDGPMRRTAPLLTEGATEKR